MGWPGSVPLFHMIQPEVETKVRVLIMQNSDKTSGKDIFLGSRVNLISKSGIRYVGALEKIDTESQTITISNVKMMGTEGRIKGRQIAPQEKIFPNIQFKHSDIADLQMSTPPNLMFGGGAPQMGRGQQPQPQQQPTQPAFNQPAPQMFGRGMYPPPPYGFPQYGGGFGYYPPNMPYPNQQQFEQPKQPEQKKPVEEKKKPEKAERGRENVVEVTIPAKPPSYVDVAAKSTSRKKSSKKEKKKRSKRTTKEEVDLPAPPSRREESSRERGSRRKRRDHEEVDEDRSSRRRREKRREREEPRKRKKRSDQRRSSRRDEEEDHRDEAVVFDRKRPKKSKKKTKKKEKKESTKEKKKKDTPFNFEAENSKLDREKLEEEFKKEVGEEKKVYYNAEDSFFDSISYQNKGRKREEKRQDFSNEETFGQERPNAETRKEVVGRRTRGRSDWRRGGGGRRDERRDDRGQRRRRDDGGNERRVSRRDQNDGVEIAYDDNRRRPQRGEFHFRRGRYDGSRRYENRGYQSYRRRGRGRRRFQNRDGGARHNRE